MCLKYVAGELGTQHIQVNAFYVVYMHYRLVTECLYLNILRANTFSVRLGHVILSPCLKIFSCYTVTVTVRHIVEHYFRTTNRP